MNKEKVYLKGYVVGHVADTLGYKGLKIQLENLDIVEIDKNLVHKDINEPQKPVVPQIVADYIENAKENDWDLQDAMNLIADEEDISVSDWFYKGKNMEKFALAWINGYEVEEEKRYRVKMKGIEGHNSYLKYNKNLKHWYFGSLFIYNNDVDTITYHTRKGLEGAGFGWVFDCPGIEIEEVTE